MPQSFRWAVLKRWLCAALLLGGIWLGATWLIRSVLPASPRWTLGENDDLEVAGISHDGSTLVTFTRRAEEARHDSGEAFCWDRPSGPLRIWDLATRTSRQVCLPDQDCTGAIGRCQDEWPKMVDPDAWHIDLDSPIRINGWALFRRQKNGNDADHFVTQQFLMNLRNGELRFFELGWDSLVQLSRTGRWYVVTSKENYQTAKIQVYETVSGEERIRIERDPAAKSGELIGRPQFSHDDTYLGCPTMMEGHKFTQVWEVATGQVVRELDEFLDHLTFAKEHHYVAGTLSRTNNWRIGTDQIWDFDTGSLVKSLTYERPLSAPEFSFEDHDRCLLWLEMFTAYEGGSPVHARINLHHAWNLATNEVVNNPYFGEDYDPNLVENGAHVPRPPRLFFVSSDDENSPTRFYDTRTGTLAYTSPAGATPVLLTNDGKLLVNEVESQPRFAQLLKRLQSMGISIPAIVWRLAPGPSAGWDVIDLSSGATIASMPARNGVHWFSGDQKTLVTTLDWDRSPPRTIEIWDFPPRGSFKVAMAWAAILPATMLIVMYRRRKKVAAPIPSESQTLDSHAR